MSRLLGRRDDALVETDAHLVGRIRDRLHHGVRDRIDGIRGVQGRRGRTTLARGAGIRPGRDTTIETRAVAVLAADLENGRSASRNAMLTDLTQAILAPGY